MAETQSVIRDYDMFPILDNLISTCKTNEKKSLICPNGKVYYSSCTNNKCKKSSQGFKFIADCHQRSCEVCQTKRGRSIFFKYRGIIQHWHNGANGLYIQFLTLTFKNKDDLEIYDKLRGNKIIKRSKFIEKCDLNLKSFIKRMMRKEYNFQYGFINKECTYHKIGDPKYNEHKQKIGEYTIKDYGYHYHFHILFYGKKIDLTQDEWNLSKIWKSITKNSYIVKLKPIKTRKQGKEKYFFENGEHALNYILKYVCKVELMNKELSLYLECIKGKRIFNTFGRDYGKKLHKIEKTKLICPECGSDLKKSMQELKGAEFLDFRKMNFRLMEAKFKKENAIKYLLECESQTYLGKTPLMEDFINFFNKQKKQLIDFNTMLMFFDEYKIKTGLKRGNLFEAKPGFLGVNIC